MNIVTIFTCMRQRVEDTMFGGGFCGLGTRGWGE